ncbi:hypothetical protein [Brevibacillus brevis]|uniref:hypothetical protein n=1 Tax=Brevibacillus brevis TaxID=1393 RepID=UPI0037C66948
MIGLVPLRKPWYTALLQEIMPVEAPCQTLHNYEFQLHIREYRSLPNSALSVCQIQAEDIFMYINHIRNLFCTSIHLPD